MLVLLEDRWRSLAANHLFIVRILVRLILLRRHLWNLVVTGVDSGRIGHGQLLLHHLGRAGRDDPLDWRRRWFIVGFVVVAGFGRCHLRTLPADHLWGGFDILWKGKE